MKLAIDLTSVGEAPTGLPKMVYNITLQLLNHYPENDYVLFFYQQIPGAFKTYTKNDRVKIICLKSKKASIMRLFTLPFTMNRIHADWNLCPAIASPLLLNGKNTISVVHDLTPWKFPQTMKTRDCKTWKLLISRAVKTNCRILTVSKTVKKELTEQFGRKDISVIYPGLTAAKNADERIVNELNLRNSTYIVTVATLEPRKNLKLLINAFDRIKQSEQYNELKLVLVGRMGWKLDEVLKHSVSEKLKNDILFTGYVSDEQLTALYRNAALFVLPSLYEGFGSPVIEAAANKLPVLISDIPVFREITDNKAIYFKLSESSLTEKIQECIGNDLKNDSRFQLLTEYVKQYTWDNYVKQLHDLLEVLNEKRK